MCGDRRGMTLIELIAAIAIAGLVMLGAVLLLDGVNTNVKRIEDDAELVTASGTTLGLLHQLLNDAASSVDTAERFVGDERGFACWTRCARAEGWMAPCRMVMTVTDSALHVSFASGEERTLQRYGRGARLRYFDADRDAWRTAWDATATIPAAVAVIAGDDTLVYSLGPARE